MSKSQTENEKPQVTTPEEYIEVTTPEEFAAAVEKGVKVFKNFDSPHHDELVLSWSPSSLLLLEWEYANRFEGFHSSFPGMFKKDMFTEELWNFFNEVKSLL